MPSLAGALRAWGTSRFKEVLKSEIEQLGSGLLPLQQALAISSHVADTPYKAMILNISEDPVSIHAKVGVFYAGIVAGCSCADDPTPLSEQPEYCEILLSIDKQTAETAMQLIED